MDSVVRGWGDEWSSNSNELQGFEVRQLRIDPSVLFLRSQRVASMVWVWVVSTRALNFPRIGRVSSDLYG